MSFVSLRLCGQILAVFGLSLVSAFGDAWPTYHGGADLQGVASVALPDHLQRLWSYNSEGTVDATPVSDGQHIFFSPGKGRIVALSLKGEKVWEKTFVRTNDAGTEVPFRFDAPFLVHQGLLLAGSSRGGLLAMDVESGEETWRIDIGGSVLGTPNFIEFDREDAKMQPRSNKVAVVVLDQSGGALNAVDMKTGKRLWTTEGVERCDGSPGVGGGYIVFGSCLAALHVVDASTGKHLRDIEVGEEGQIAGGVAIDGNQAFCGTRDGRLICANVGKGTIVWTSDESEEQTFSTPAVGERLVVYSSDNGFVYAVDRKIGRTVWKFDTGGCPTSPVIAGDKVLFSADGVLFMLKLQDGSLLWKKEISDDLTSPALIDDFVVVGADDGTVSAWGAGSEEKK